MASSVWPYAMAVNMPPLIQNGMKISVTKKRKALKIDCLPSVFVRLCVWRPQSKHKTLARTVTVTPATLNHITWYVGDPLIFII